MCGEMGHAPESGKEHGRAPEAEGAGSSNDLCCCRTAAEREWDSSNLDSPAHDKRQDDNSAAQDTSADPVPCPRGAEEAGDQTDVHRRDQTGLGHVMREPEDDHPEGTSGGRTMGTLYCEWVVTALCISKNNDV